ncbi:MAG: hypothetical protein K9M99_12460 [Candidatus Cloacimonetes bacterium]|nr:hypothetical protein [Candidatus Cloacimonadota bacterium]
MIPDGREFQIGRLKVNTFSIADWASWLVIPSWDIILDIGQCITPMLSVSRLFISSLQEEHYQGIAMYLAHKALTKKIPQIYLPARNVEILKAFIKALPNTGRSGLSYKITGLEDGDEVILDNRKVMKVFETTQSANALGCIIAEPKRKLKKEYLNLTTAEINESIGEKKDIFEVNAKPLLAYIPEATPRLFDAHPEFLQSETLITGCRSYDTIGTASKTEEPQILAIAEKLEAFQGKYLVFNHVPAKYTSCDIYAFLLPRLPEIQRQKLSVIPYRDTRAIEGACNLSSRPERLSFDAAQEMLSVSEWQIVEYPGYFGYKKAKLTNYYAEKYGEYQIAWEVNKHLLYRQSALQLYENAYYQYLKNNPELTDWLVNTAADIYDTAPGNVESGIDYNIQDELSPNHLHDIAIRRCLVRMDKWFKGKHYLEVRSLKSEGYVLNPGIVPFHKPELIHQPEWESNWIIPGSIESFWQSNKVIIIPHKEGTFL